MLLLKAAQPSLIDINFGLMFWTLVTFVIVLVVLKWKAFGPIQSAIDARRAAIESDINAAQSAREEAQTALAELTVATAEKVVRTQLDEDEQRRLIDEALEGVDFSQFAAAEPTESGE